MQQITINIIKIGRIYTFFKTKMSENSFFFYCQHWRHLNSSL